MSTFESTKALHESEKAIKKAEKELQSIETERNTYIQASGVINPAKLKTLTNRVTFATKQLELLQK